MNWLKIKAILGCVLFFTLVLGSIAAYYGEIDSLYVKCMENKSKEICAKQQKQMAQFSAWQPHVKCIGAESTNWSTPINPYYTGENEPLYIFSEKEIKDCWAIAKG